MSLTRQVPLENSCCILIFKVCTGQPLGPQNFTDRNEVAEKDGGRTQETAAVPSRSLAIKATQGVGEDQGSRHVCIEYPVFLSQIKHRLCMICKIVRNPLHVEVWMNQSEYEQYSAQLQTDVKVDSGCSVKVQLDQNLRKNITELIKIKYEIPKPSDEYIATSINVCDTILPIRLLLDPDSTVLSTLQYLNNTMCLDGETENMQLCQVAAVQSRDMPSCSEAANFKLIKDTISPDGDCFYSSYSNCINKSGVVLDFPSSFTTDTVRFLIAQTIEKQPEPMLNLFKIYAEDILASPEEIPEKKLLQTMWDAPDPQNPRKIPDSDFSLPFVLTYVMNRSVWGSDFSIQVLNSELNDVNINIIVGFESPSNIFTVNPDDMNDENKYCFLRFANRHYDSMYICNPNHKQQRLFTKDQALLIMKRNENLKFTFVKV